MKVLYVAGLGRSGSTLLSRLLGQVDGICAMGEAHHLWRTGAPRSATDELCGCGRTYAECGFWPDRLRAVFGGETPLDEMKRLADRVARIRRIPQLEGRGDEAFESAVRDYGAVWRSLYEGVAAATGASVVLDVSKDLGPLFLLSRIKDLEVSVVHLVRDPRGVAYSWGSRTRRPEFVDREVWMNRHGAVNVAWRWTYSNHLAERARRLFPSYLRLRYEDLVLEPRSSLERICALVGLDRADMSFIQGSDVKLARTNCTLSGNPMRFGEGGLTVRADTRWHECYPWPKRALVSLLTWPQRRRYSYAEDST